jgi:alpha-maltose-1-phosphate synthase
MKLLTVTHYFASRLGGIEIVAEQLSKALAATGPAEIVWAASDTSPPPADFPGECVGLRCTSIVERLAGLPWPVPTLGALRRLSALVSDADIILLHDALYPANIAAFLLARHRRKRIIIVQHIGHVPYRSALLNWLMGLANRIIAVPMLSNADRVVFISGLTADYFFRRCTFRHPPTVIFNGIAEGMVDVIASRPKEASAARSGPPTVAFVGRFVEKKGLSVLEHVVRALPDVRFILAGSGAIRPESWQAGNVTIRRNLGKAALVGLYRSADLLVLPSVGEGFPLVIQEALCCGVPVLCGEEILRADPWLDGRIDVAPVDLKDPVGTAAIWAARIAEIVSGQRESPKVDAAGAVGRYTWRRAAVDYWRLLDEIGAADPAFGT